jgi:multiple sugar transport system permease protein
MTVINDAASTHAAQRSHRRQTLVAFWMFVGPLVLGLAIFVYAPILWGFWLSLFDAHATLTPTHFVGLTNYLTLLHDTQFLNSLSTIVIFAVFIVPITFSLALFLAVLIKSVRLGQGLFRTIFFIPTACSYVVASLVWKMSLFNGLPYGFANMILGLLGQQSIAWIGTANPPWYWLVLITVRLWLQLGFYMIIFLAGLQEIPQELYEAARVDGAKAWQTFSNITFPLLRNTSISVLLLILIAAFQAFDEFYNVLSGGSYSSTGNLILARPPLVYLYNLAFTQQNYGLGSAGAFILTAIIIGFTVVQGRLFGFGREVN